MNHIYANIFGINIGFYVNWNINLDTNNFNLRLLILQGCYIINVCNISCYFYFIFVLIQSFIGCLDNCKKHGGYMALFIRVIDMQGIILKKSKKGYKEFFFKSKY